MLHAGTAQSANLLRIKIIQKDILAQRICLFIR